MTADAIAARLMLDIAVVIAMSTVFGAIARRIGQPTVIGQILAGLLLGPTLLGRMPGHLTAHLFPAQVLPYLTVVAQLAVVVFMFSVGYEIDLRLVRQGRVIPLVAAGAFITPLALSMAGVLLLRTQFASIGQRVVGWPFLLFMGVALAVTALPVLAAITRERELAGTTVGVIATAAAGAMDLLAWVALAAALIGSGHRGGLPWPAALLLLACFTGGLLLVVRPALSFWLRRRQSPLTTPVPVAFVLAMACAWITTSLGLHAVFGGFLAGLTMRSASTTPDPALLRSLDQVGSLLLPLYFVVTGLSLNIGAMRGGDAFLLLLIILVIASAGKLVPGYVVPRACRLDARSSAMIAALVNTRGLTELVALNIGLSSGIIGSRLFSILVLMAFFTTIATGPLLSLISRSATDGHRLPQGGVRDKDETRTA
jgi:Kef-type K+ transport system membrane component KefB